MEHRTNETPLLQTIGLQKYFKVRGNSLLHAVDGIDLTLYSGQTLGVVGESGCGKSTLGRTILKLIEPTGGQILYNGKDITKLSTRKMHPYRKEMQIIFQDPYSSIDPRKSVIEVIAEYMLIHKVYKTQAEAFNRAAELMDLVGLARRYTNSYPHELDGGRRQRIGIARALIMEPEFIIADEPISALDVSIRAQVLNLMAELQRRRGLTYLLISHDLSVMHFICDRIAVIHLGRIVELSSTEKLFAHPLHPYTRALLSAIPLPDPAAEKRKVLEVYDPSCHHYEADPPTWTEIEPGHFVLANQEELEKYRTMI